MKCATCSRDSKKREREGGKCPGCGKRFVFDPPTEGVSDYTFRRAIDKVSAEGSVRFGVEHLRYEVARRMKSVPWGWVGTVLGAGASGFLVHPVVGVGLLVPLWYLLVKRRAHQMKMSEETFARLWQRWVDVHGTPPAAIVRKQQERGPYRSVDARSEPDVRDYSFDRAVICDRPRTVDLLLANNFHFENNCAVLAVTGYPPRAFETVRVMLRRNPRLQVFVLHDASFAGCTLAHRLANDPDWFKGHGRVIDVGLRPRHAPPFKGFYLPARETIAAGTPGVTAEEAAWLAVHTLELAVIRPEQVMKRLFRAMTRADESAADGSSGGGGGDGDVHVDGDSFAADADASDGGADSFG
jgi:DNA-directed RNA polymerase subunit RPC12/RpoP